MFFLPLPVKVPDFMGGGTPLPLGGPCPFIMDLGRPMSEPDEECFLPFITEPLPM